MPSGTNRFKRLAERPEANTLTLLSTQLIGKAEVNALKNACFNDFLHKV